MVDLLNNIPNNAFTLLTIWLVLLLLTIFLFYKNNRYWKFSLFVSAFCIAAAFALFSPFLYPWDEQFHALVAKNCLSDPFHPKILKSDPIGHDSNDWILTTTWLHKQPLFTWLMAISMKIFGVSTFAVRLPSVLFHAVLTLVVYRIASLLFSKKAGFISALLFMHSAYLLGLISGRIGTDHNDYIFMSFIGLSFWAYFEWRESSLKKWIIWIGVFVGCAVLTKWLVGLLVFFGWGTVFLVEWIRFKDFSQFKPILKSLSISIAIFLPWQIYTFLRFPEMAKKEMEYNALHIWNPVEGHVGDRLFHFDQITELYFYKIDFLWILSISILFLFIRKVEWRKTLVLLSSIFVVYAFFTMVQTKMPSFTIPVYLLVLILIGFGLSTVFEFIKQRIIKNLAVFIGTLLLINFLLKPLSTLEIYGFQSDTDNRIKNQLYQIQANFIHSNFSSETNRIVFGCELRGVAFASWMFYTNDLAYPFYPNKNDINTLIGKGYQVLLIDWNNSIPEELKGDTRLKILVYPD